MGSQGEVGEGMRVVVVWRNMERGTERNGDPLLREGGGGGKGKHPVSPAISKRSKPPLLHPAPSSPRRSRRAARSLPARGNGLLP